MENGIISVDGSLFEQSNIQNFNTLSLNVDVIAPFWSTVDLTRFGSVYFRISITPGSQDFEEAAELALRTFPAIEFNVTSVLVVTWYRVAEENFASQVAITS